MENIEPYTSIGNGENLEPGMSESVYKPEINNKSGAKNWLIPVCNPRISAVVLAQDLNKCSESEQDLTRSTLNMLGEKDTSNVT